MLALMAVGAALLVLLSLATQRPIDAFGLLATYGTLFATLALVHRWNERGRTVLGGYVLSVGLWLIVSSTLWTYGGLSAQSAVTYTVCVLIAGYAVSSFAAALLAVASAAWLGVVLYAEHHGLLPPARATLTSLDHMFATDASLLVTVSLVGLSLATLDRALRRAEANEAAAHRAAAALQASRAEAEARARQAEALATIGEAALTAEGTDALAAAAVDAIARATATDATALLTVYRDRLECVGASTCGCAPTADPTHLPWVASLRRERLPREVTGSDAAQLGAALGREPLQRALLAPIAASGGDPQWLLIAKADPGEFEPGTTVFLQTAARTYGAALARNLAEERARTAQKMEALGLLAGGVAHDFNNLLTTILSGVESIADDLPADPAAQSVVPDLKRACEHGALLTRQLLAFARQEVREPAPQDLNRLILDVAGVLRRLMGPGIELTLELDPDNPTILGDRGAIEQVLLNLGVNARDACSGRGKVRVRTTTVHSSDGARVRLHFEDDGMGMDETVRAKLFEPFFTTKGAGRGTGLGLATVYGIVRDMGGTIEVDSEPGRGALFRIDVAQVVAAAPSPPAESSVVAPLPGRPRILLIDDDPLLRRSGERVLRGAGYDVRTVDRAEAALEALAAAPGEFALIVSDVVMPGLGGIGLVEALRSRADAPPVLLTTGYADAELLAGIEPTAVLPKPYTRDELRLRVAALLGERRRPPSGPQRAASGH